MWSVLVVVLDVDAKDVGELAAAEDQEPVEPFAADGSDPALHVSVRIGCSDGRPDDLDSIAREEGVERARELRVAVVDQEPSLPVAVLRDASAGCAPAAAST